MERNRSRLVLQTLSTTEQIITPGAISILLPVIDPADDHGDTSEVDIELSFK